MCTVCSRVSVSCSSVVTASVESAVSLSGEAAVVVLQ